MPQVMTVPGGSVTARVRDGGQLLQSQQPRATESAAEFRGPWAGRWMARRLGIEQFSGLMRRHGHRESAPPTRSRSPLQTGSIAMRFRRPGARRTTSIWRRSPLIARQTTLWPIRASCAWSTPVTPELYERLRPWICALPGTALLPINVNTLLPEQAPLLAMLAPIGSASSGRVNCWRAARLMAMAVSLTSGRSRRFRRCSFLENVQKQVQQKSRWFDVSLLGRPRRRQGRRFGAVRCRDHPGAGCAAAMGGQ